MLSTDANPPSKNGDSDAYCQVSFGGFFRGASGFWNRRSLAVASMARAVALASEETPNVAVGPQYDTAHVYVAPDDLNRFVASLLATFGGTASKPVAVSILPTPSSCLWQAVRAPRG